MVATQRLYALLAGGLLVGLVACGGGQGGTGKEGSSTSSDSGDGDGDGDGDEDDDEDEGDESSTSADDSDDATFADDGADLAPVSSCDLWEQDCEAGEKCVPYIATPGSGAWDTHHCVPSGTVPPGQPCTSTDIANTLDDCDATGFCWGVQEDGTGTCIEMCVGSESAPQCPQTLRGECTVSATGVLATCFSACDPLAGDASGCEPGQLCITALQGGIQITSFVCFPPGTADPGGTGDPCSCRNCCETGFVCWLDGSHCGGDPADESCCTPLCDLTDPAATDTCEAAYPGTECIALFEAAHPYFSHIGLCDLQP